MKLAQEEKELLAALAVQSRRIFEIGAGESTAIMCHASPDAHVTTVDNFVWGTEERFRTMMAGLTNYTLIVQNSLLVKWDGEPIDLLFVDGAHDWDRASHDLFTWGAHSRVIAMHDYDREGVKRAVDAFLAKYKEWHIAKRVQITCVLERATDV